MSLLNALEQFGRSTGDYWSEDNARFEKTNPGLVDRGKRLLDPMTGFGFGSAVGAFKDAAGKGFPFNDTMLAALQAIPLAGYVRALAIPGKGLVKSSSKIVNDIPKTAAIGVTTSGLGIEGDRLQAAAVNAAYEAKLRAISAELGQKYRSTDRG